MALPALLNFYTASDYATQQDEGDHTEHGCFGVDKDGEVWLADWFYGRVTTDVGINELLKMKKRNFVIKGFGEMGVIRHAIEPAFKRQQRETGIRMKIEYLSTAGTKAARALSFQALARSGKVHIPNCPWGDRLIAQIVDFNGRQNTRLGDDGVDCCAIFARAYENIRWAKVLCPKPERVHIRFGSIEWLELGTERINDVGTRRF